jgi:hypothetical protein
MAPGSKIFHARAFEGGKSNMEIILNALDWAAEQNVQIVNMSFVGPKNALLEQASRGARARGMILVAAAGNNGPGAPYGYPAAYKGVIAVTATDANDAIMKQANRGPYVYISAPGVDLMAPSAAAPISSPARRLPQPSSATRSPTCCTTSRSAAPTRSKRRWPPPPPTSATRAATPTSVLA